jgi:ParB-like chromosome segregation protein Spo0J
MSKKPTAEFENLSSTRARASMSTIDVWCRFDEAKDITTLIPNPRNPNTHGDKQIALLAKIIRNQGWRQPITVSNRSGFIVKGHGRLAAAKMLQVEQVPVEFQDYATEADEYADLIADNRIAELAEIDAMKLEGLLTDETIFEGFDMDLTGFTEDQIKPLEIDFEDPDNADAGSSGKTVTCPKCGFEHEL